MKYSIVVAATAIALAGGAAPASAYMSAFSTSPVYMRSGPDLAYPPVGLVPAGSPVTVFGCLGGWQWCDVSWGGNRGWVAGTYLQAQYQNRPTPFYYAAPRHNVPIVTFNFGHYWDTHYRSRHWYQNRAHWSRWDHGNRRWHGDYRQHDRRGPDRRDHDRDRPDRRDHRR